MNELTLRQLDQVLRNAAEAPMTNPDLVAARVEAETKQASTLNSFEFKLDGKPITANDIDNKLDQSTDLTERRKVWEASKESGPALKPGLVKLRDLRNGVAKELGHKDYFALQVAAYGMTTDELVKMHEDFLKELRPLYLQLHTWTKHKLAEKYKQPVPKRIPAHWINNRWSQNWDGLVEGADIEDRFKGRARRVDHQDGRTILHRAWLQSSAGQLLDEVGSVSVESRTTRARRTPTPPAGTSIWRTTFARCMSVEPNSRWFYTAHHELGHGYYFMAYTRPEVPPLLRTGANPGYHEGMGELISLASSQVPYLQSQGVLPADFKADATAFLLNDALANSLPFMFWGSGTMTHWEADVYAKNLPPDQWNARWWQYVRDLQGVEPPAARGEEFCDAATKTHINDTPAYYHSYAFATVLKFQLHDHIARKILKQPPQACNYANNKEVGAFLKKIMEKGGTEDWRKVLKDATGEELSTRAMVEYFKPLMAWLEKENKGRQIGWE